MRLHVGRRFSFHSAFIVGIFVIVIGGIVIGGAGKFYGMLGGKNKAEATLQMKEYLEGETYQKIRCMNGDTNYDGYVTCTVTANGMEKKYDCDGYVFVGVGSCKPVEHKIRVDGGY